MKRVVKKAAKKAAKAVVTRVVKAAVRAAVRTAVKTAVEKAAKTSAKKGAKKTVKKTATSARQRRAAPRAPDATLLYDRLAATYPDAHCALDHRNAYELLVATILSAQCTDKRVNLVTPALFAAYPTPAALAAARQEDVEALVKTTGFFRMKAKNLIAMATALVARHGGEVPREMDALVALPGVGRKTANVILGNVFAINEGIVVDTHVGRLSRRLGFATSDDAVRTEQELVPLFPRERWTMLAHLLIEHGRRVCDARKPKCGSCVVQDLCPSAVV
jgi:endonuclease III